MPRHETLNTAIKSCTWVSEWKIQKGKNPPSISVLHNHCPSIQHSPKEQFSLSVLKYSSLHPSMDKSQLRTDHMKVRNGHWGVTGSKNQFCKSFCLFERWAGPRQLGSKWRQRHCCPYPCSHCHVHTLSPYDDVLITHSLCKVDLSATHLFLAGSKLQQLWVWSCVSAHRRQEEEKSW